MGDLGTLERRLQRLDTFREPRVALEQYPTPAPLAARILHTAALNGDVRDRTVVDLGAGTGVLAIGAALAGALGVVGVERDRSAVETARENERTALLAASQPGATASSRPADGGKTPIEWVHADATAPPLRASDERTVVMNPPFGARDGRRGADRAFLDTASTVAGVSYSIHNDGSRDFLAAFVPDRGGRITDRFAAELALDRTFSFHDSDREALPVVVVRIDWAGGR